MKVLILDNYDSFTYNLFHYVEGLGEEVVVKRNDEISIEEIAEFDKIILSPGPGLPQESTGMMRIIDHWHDKKPFLGVCLGMQALAIYFGDKLFNSLNALHDIFVFLTQHLIPFTTNIIIFYFILKYISDGVVLNRLALAGSVVTSTLLYLGQLGIKYYLTHYFFAKDAGIAGTILILLAWVYYTSQIIFFGAKFTAVYAKILGRPIVVK